MFHILRSLLLPNRSADSPAPISTDSILRIMDAYLTDIYNPILPASDSPARTPFASTVPSRHVSMMNLTLRQRLAFARNMLPLFAYMVRGARLYAKPCAPKRETITENELAALEAQLRSAGAISFGYTDIPPALIFQGKRLPAEHAIVFAVAMDEQKINSSPSFGSMLEVSRGYMKLARVGWKATTMLRARGFAAYPGTALGGLTDYPHMAERAGLGAIGYHGLLISPSDGARIRINVIYTNIANLPRQHTNPHVWVRDFCALCKKCVRSCPADAIFVQPIPRTGGGHQCIEHAACREFFTRNHGCGICMAVCPFSNVGYSRVLTHFKGNPKAPGFRVLSD